MRLYLKHGWKWLAGALVVSVFVLVVIVTMASLQSMQSSNTNQGYLRYLACVTQIRNAQGKIAVSGEVSEHCWKLAEERSGVSLPRFTTNGLKES